MTQDPAARAPRLRVGGQDGSALVLALLFLTVCGVTIGALLTFANTSSNATISLRSARGTDYDAHAAMQVEIASVRMSGSCGTGSSGYTRPASLLNNASLPVRVDCYQLSSSSSGASAKRNDVFLVCPASVNPPCDSDPTVPLLQVNVTFYDSPAFGSSIGIQTWSSR